MEYVVLTLEEVTEEELLEGLKVNARVAKIKRQEIERLKRAKSSKSNHQEARQDSQPLTMTCINASDPKKESFEQEVAYYFARLQKLTKDNLEVGIAHYLPSKSNPNYEMLMQRLKAEVLKEMKELKEFISLGTISAEDLVDFKEDILTSQRKIALIDAILNAKEEVQVETQEESSTEENNLIFVPTNYGTIRILEEIGHIPDEYYDDFRKLFQSIKDGTFKNVKRLTSGNSAASMLEVKGWKTRVVFDRIDKNSYALITAFIKKSDNDLGYRSSLENACSNYLKMENSLKQNLQSEDFLALNKQYEEELFSCLSKGKEKPTVKRKDVQNG